MIRITRLAVLLLVPILFWGASYVAPNLVHADNLRLLATVVTVPWVLDFVFFQRLGSLTNLNALDSRNLERLNDRLAHIRKRVWWMAGICMVCSGLIWFLAAGQMLADPHHLALAIGFCVGICAQYLVVFPFWFNELQAFQDRLRTRDAKNAKKETVLKQMAEAK